MEEDKPPARSRAGRPPRDAGLSVREDLIKAAVLFLRTETLESLTMRKVAALARVSHVATYHHFENKNALLAAVAEEGYGRFFEAYSREISQDGDGFANRLRSLGWAYVLFILENPQQARIMFGPSSLILRDNPRLMTLSTRSYRMLHRIIRMGQAMGAISAGNARRKTLAAWSMIHGMAMLLLEGRLPAGPSLEDTKRMVWSITDYAYFGMRGDSVAAEPDDSGPSFSDKLN